jgi:hypothetical protein
MPQLLAMLLLLPVIALLAKRVARNFNGLILFFFRLARTRVCAPQ